MKAGWERESLLVWTKWLIFSGSPTSIQILSYYSANIHTSCFTAIKNAQNAQAWLITLFVYGYIMLTWLFVEELFKKQAEKGLRARGECHKTWAIKHTDSVKQSALKVEQQTINEKCIGWQPLSATSEIIASMFTKLRAYSMTIWKVSMKLNSLNRLIISNSSTTSCKSQSEESNSGWEGFLFSMACHHGLSCAFWFL